ncbi:MAG: TonB-dependent receptor [Leptothrix sp. (in: b-proteobacteria)]
MVACLVLGGLVTSVPLAWAQPDLDQVVVTGVRQPQPLSRIAADVQVINAERIRSSTADSVEDLLRREAGVQISRNGGPGQSAGLMIRGAAAVNTVVFVDGVRVGSATLGQTDLSGLSLAQIERIEVLRGPASSLYGADAVGGVVQIFTRRGTQGLNLNARAAVGGYSSKEGSLGLNGAQGQFDYALNLADERTAGVSALRPGDQFGNYNPDRDGAHRTTGQVALGFTPVQGHRFGLTHLESRLKSQYDASEFLAPTYAQNATPDFRSRLDTSITSIDHRGQIDPTLTVATRLSRSDDELNTGAHQIDHFFTRRDQFTTQLGWAVDAQQQWVAALEHQVEKAQSSSYLSDVSRQNNAVVLGYSGSFDRYLLQADVRHDNNSVYGGVTTARLGGSLGLAAGWRLRALAGTTYRAPSFNDLYYPGYGIATIAPEHGRSVELGLTWRKADTDVSATVYRNRLRDLIAYESDRSFCPADPAYNFGCARNINRAKLQGATLVASQRWSQLSLSGTVDILHATDEATGSLLSRRASHQENLSADYRLSDWTLGASALRVGARPDGGKVLEAYGTFDLKAFWHFAPQWRLEAKLLNAANRDIEPARDYQGLGRQGWLGVRFDGALL